MRPVGRGAAAERGRLQCAVGGGGRCVLPSRVRAFRALSLGLGGGDLDWQRPQRLHLQRGDNGRVVVRTWGRGRNPKTEGLRGSPRAHARRAPIRGGRRCAPRGVTAPSQWLRWRRARDCAAASALHRRGAGTERPRARSVQPAVGSGAGAAEHPRGPPGTALCAHRTQGPGRGVRAAEARSP